MKAALLCLVCILAALIGACDARTEWTDDGRPPAGAARELGRVVGPSATWETNAAAAEWIAMMVRNEARDYSGEHPKFGFSGRYESMRDELLRKAPAERRSRLFLETFRETLYVVLREAELLAHRRLVLEAPTVVSYASRDEGWMTLAEAPVIDRAEIDARVDDLARLLEHGIRTYARRVGGRWDCSWDIVDRVDEARTLLANAKGDFGTTTGPMFELLTRARRPTEPLTYFDRGIIAERRMRCVDDATGPAGGR